MGKDEDEAKGEGDVEMVLGPSPLDGGDSDDDDTTDDDLSDSDIPEEVLTGWPRTQQVMNEFTDSRGTTILMAAVTFYALFGDDSRLAWCPKEADVVFMVLSSISFFLFLIELVLNSLGKTTCGRRPKSDGESRGGWKERACGLRGYLFSFFFTLDFVATLSLLPEITWLWGPIIGDDDDSGSTNLSAARAGRVSRAGSKAGRIIRMVRLVRLVKLYMLARRKRNLDHATVQQSKVGSKLSDLTTRRVIVVVLVMLIVVPIFTYTEEDFSEEFATQYVHRFNTWRQPGWDAAPRQLKTSFSFWPDSTDPRLVKLQLFPNNATMVVPSDIEVDNSAVYNDLRTGLAGNELKRVLYDEVIGGDKYTTQAWFDQKTLSRETALFGIALTVFVTILLAAGALQFTSDAQRLVLRPIEEMAAFVKRMAENPLTPISSQDNSGQFETNLLENTIKKIGGLLRVGFGQAGAPIIANNLRSSSGGFNPMVEGRKINAIFGFISIMQFDASTEVLQQDVLLFVNNISKVVHDVVMAWGGAPNKNLGEAYLLTWLLDPPEETAEATPKKRPSMAGMRRRASVAKGALGGDGPASPAKSWAAGRRMSLMSQASTRSGKSSASRKSAKEVKKNDEIDLSSLPNAQKSAGQALMAFLKIIGEVSRSKDIIDSPENHLLTQAIRGYYVRLRYGLHVGWGIEGAIGSMHKVDASYLSPHVNIAARMQAAATQYGKPLLMSGPFVNLLSETARRYCRKLDVVAVKGSKVPMPVWTYDVWEWKHVEPSQLMNFESFVQYCTDADVFNTNQKYTPGDERRISVLGAAPIIEHPVERASFDDTLFETDQELRAFRAPFNKSFRRRFAMGVDLYLAGEWLKARAVLEKTLTEPTLPSRDGDGPSRTLLTYMSRFGYRAPPTWAGFRALTSK